MSIDTLAKEAARRAQGEIAMVDVPETEAVMTTRRAQHRNRTLAASALVVVVVVLGLVAAVAAAGTTGSKHTQIATHPKHTPAVLEFRPVLGLMPYAGTGAGTCQNGKLVTPPAQRSAQQVILAANDRKSCYILGPTVMTGAGITAADPNLDPGAGAWIVNVTFGNDDFATKVARPFVNKQIAIVVDGTVYSAPTINPGITGRDVAISGDFTRNDAIALAAKLLGKDPVDITLPESTPTTVQQGPLQDGLAMMGATPAADGTAVSASSPDVVHSVARNDAKLGWVVDVTLTPEAAQRLAGESAIYAQVDGSPATVTRGPRGVFTFSSYSAQWDEMTARDTAVRIIAGAQG